MNVRRARLAASGLVAMSVVALTAGPSPAPAAAAGLSLRLVSQALTVAPDSDTTLVFHADGPIPPEATIVVQAYTRVETRGGVREAIDRRPAGNVVSGGRVEYDPAQLVPVGDDLSLVVGVQTARVTRDRLRLANPGLYPITLEVLVDDKPLASLLMFIERTGETPPTAVVQIAIALGVDAAPTLGADGTTTISDETRREIDQLIATLESTTAPMTVAVRPELLEGLRRSGVTADNERLAALSVALARHQLLPDTYVALDPSNSLAADLGAEFTDQLRAGQDAIRATLTIATARKTWWVRGPIDPGGLDLLRVSGFGQLLVPSTVRTDLPSHDGELGTPTTNDGGAMPSLMGDLVVQDRLADGADDPVLSAHHIVADLIAMSLEAEAAVADTDESPAPLGLLIDTSGLQPAGGRVFASLLTLLGETDRVRLGTADDVIDSLYAATRDTQLDRFSMKAPQGAADAGTTIAALGRIREAITSTATMLPDDSVTPARWKTLAAVLPADNLSTTEREAYIRQLDGEIGELRQCITVRTSGQVSLGGRVSKVPLTLLNSCATPLKVRVRLSSPKLRLSQPDTLAEVTDRYQFDIPVEARTNGLFVVNVELLTPGGSPAAQLSRPVTFTVEASALTGLGQVITAAFLLVLATRWIQHGLHRRRLARAAAAAPYLPAHPSGGGEAG